MSSNDDSDGYCENHSEIHETNDEGMARANKAEITENMDSMVPSMNDDMKKGLSVFEEDLEAKNRVAARGAPAKALKRGTDEENSTVAIGKGQPKAAKALISAQEDVVLRDLTLTETDNKKILTAEEGSGSPFDPNGDIMPIPTQLRRQNADVEALPGAYAAGTPGLPITRQVELQLSLVGAAARAQSEENVNQASFHGTDSKSSGLSCAPSSTANLAVANLVTEINISQLPAAEPDVGEMDEIRRERRNTTNKYLLAGTLVGIFILVVIGIILAVVFARPTDDDSIDLSLSYSDQNGRLTKEEYMSSLLPDETVAKIDIDAVKTNATDTTPQTKAFLWSLNDPNFESYEGWQLVQRFALVCFFYSTGGDTSCVELNHAWMANNSLTGPLPLEFFLLTSLRSIDLTDNPGLTGTISSKIELTGQLPSEIGLNTNPSIVGFWGNALTGTIPTELGQLTSNFLDLSGNQLTGLLPSELGNLLRNLVTFSQKYVDIMEELIPGIDRKFVLDIILQAALENSNNAILLGNNQLSGTIPTELGNFDDVQVVSLTRNALTGTIPTELDAFIAIQFSDRNNPSGGGLIDCSKWIIAGFENMVKWPQWKSSRFSLLIGKME
ncbi:leucine Rich Repeat [Seminavis robusta]|uniref:Leucine Rich Repeat n=1 Tax=Seminavis robusta TaxID=568900 RepID=A0A9N8DGK2_9STRA|nr:leucine Rich Repeat [Seminavis robusta]|eukprot:Sro134_g063420.1 leucine Rich Repeat (613) ;mRNA; f:42326-44933